MPRSTPPRPRPAPAMASMMLLLAITSSALVGGGCATDDASRRTVRLIDGKLEVTRYVSPNAYRHYLEARLRLGHHDTTGALEELRAALIFDEHSPLLYTELAKLYHTLGRDADARRALKKALDIRGDFPDALLLEGDLARRDRPDAAEHAYRRCVAVVDLFYPCAARLAALLESRDHPEEARDVWLALLRRHPKERRAHGYLADLALRHLDLDRAAKHYARTLEGRAPLPLLLRAARVARARGDIAQATKILHEVFDRSGGDLDVAQELLEILLESKARQTIDDLLAVLHTHADRKPTTRARVARLFLLGKRPRDALAIVAGIPAAKRSVAETVAYGLALDALGRHDDARAALMSVVKKKAGPLAALELAQIYRRRGHLERAQRLLETTTKLHPGNAGLVAALSAVYFTQGKKARSLAILHQALATRGGDRQLHFLYAAALERAGYPRRAITEIDGLRASYKNVAAYHNFIGYVLAEHHLDLDRATRHLRRALRLAPTRAYFIDSWGWLLFRRGDPKAGKRFLTFALRLAPKDAEITAHLAEVEAALGHHKEAITLFTRAISQSERPWKTTRWRARLKHLASPHVGSSPSR